MVLAVVPQPGVEQWWWGGPAGIGPTWACSLPREKDKKESPEIFLGGGCGVVVVGGDGDGVTRMVSGRQSIDGVEGGRWKGIYLDHGPQSPLLVA